jgi:formylmethanofuran dehydrogenase subunit E
MIWTDDPERDAAMYDMERQRELDSLPKCDICGEPITDDFLYDIDGTLVCEKCLNEEYRKPVDNYIEN